MPQAKYGWDGAAETMYQTLLARGQIHTDMNAPRGALAFSRGSDGPTQTLPGAMEPISPLPSKGFPGGTAAGTIFRFCTARISAAAGLTAAGAWAIPNVALAALS